MFKIGILAAFLALAASQPAVQQHYQKAYFNRPSYRYQQEYYGYNPRYSDLFGQYEVIALVNDQNQPLGYVYNVNSEAAREQRQNLIQVIDNAGSVFAYYSVNRFTPGQEFVAEPISQNVVSQLAEFGVSYVSQRPGEPQALVFTNPNVLSFNRNGVLSPSYFENRSYNQQEGENYPFYYNGQYPQQFGYRYRYGQEYQGSYPYYYQGRYGYQYQGPYGYQYQGPYGYQYQGSYGYQYQGPYSHQYQGPYAQEYQRPYAYQYQGPYAQHYQGPYAYQYQGPYARYPNYYNQEIAA